ncbi:lipopolysaccharide biosynthesis protein [Anaeromyxobacter sp. SG26]|uniref:lipopolysaccharide biosynthesis protein n=1 Tax=Anaeromyxobacter sp. SG26 TaxID=2925407 RepID=UPI001F59F761|nr:oligosaccharide flippase family protein [Anaeromyxobacter sp. SG26]
MISLWLSAASKAGRSVRIGARPFATSVLNQALSSATSFAIAFVLLRWLSPSDYGAYGIGMSICYFYAGVGNAAIITQMVVHFPDRPVEERRHYAARMMVALALACGTTLLVVALAASSFRAALSDRAPALALALAVALAAVCYLLKDFFIRFAYTSRAETDALIVNGVAAATLALALSGAWLLRWELDAAGALLVFALSQSSGVLAGLWKAKLPLRAVRWTALVEDAREAWGHGRWALGGVAVSWLQTQGYAYVTLASLGAEGVGRANAARLLISPFLLLTPAINQVIMPRLAEHRAQDPRNAVRVASRVTLASLGFAVLYAVVLILSTGTMVPFVLGPKYSGMTALVAAWCVVLVCTLLRDGAANLFYAMKQFRAVTVTNAISASAALVATLVLVRALGGPGAVLGSAVGEIFLAAMLWERVRSASPQS